MRKFIIFAILVIFGLQYGKKYILSEDFQKYGDKKKAVWTCYVNDFIGEFYIALSRYGKAQPFFERSKKRCKGKPIAEKAAFKVAYCLENTNRGRAKKEYLQFIEDFPESKRVKLAQKKVSRLSF